MQRRAATRRRPQGVRLLQNSLSHVKHVRQPICLGVTHLGTQPSSKAADGQQTTLVRVGKAC